MKLSIKAGETSQSVNVFIMDSSSAVGAGLAGLVFNSAGLTAYYSHAGTFATATQIVLATLAAVNSAWSSGGFKEIDAANMPGWYRLDLPNAVLAASKGRVVSVHLKGAANMAPLPLEIALQTDVNPTHMNGTEITANAGPNWVFFWEDNGSFSGRTLIELFAAIDVIDNFLDTEVLAIKAKTDQLTFTTPNVLDAAFSAITVAICNKIADHVRRRQQANVEASSDGDALSVSSEYGSIQQIQESNTTAHAGKLTVFKTDGTTELAQKDLATSASADPVTGVS